MTDLIPQIGATLGAVIVSLVGFATDLPIGIACVVFFVIYQQVENYLIYPKMMRRSVEVNEVAALLAALLGVALLGVVGALIAIPTVAALQLILREVVLPRQESPLRTPDTGAPRADGPTRLGAAGSVRARAGDRAVGEGGHRPVGVGAGVGGLHRAVPLVGSGYVDGRVDPPHDLVEHRLGVADPQVLGAVDADHLGLRHRGEPLPGLGRPQVVVELGHQRGQRLAGLGPGGEVARRSEKRSGGESRIAPATAGSQPYISARSVPNDQPSSQMLRQVGELGVLDRGRDVEPLAHARRRTRPRWCPARCWCPGC